MDAWAITDKHSLQTVYVGLHTSSEEAWQIFLGWPDAEEVQRAKMNFVCTAVDMYPKAQRCRTSAHASESGK